MWLPAQQKVTELDPETGAEQPVSALMSACALPVLDMTVPTVLQLLVLCASHSPSEILRKDATGRSKRQTCRASCWSPACQ